MRTHRSLIAYASRVCSLTRGAGHSRRSRFVGENAKKTLESLDPWLLKQQDVSEWAGTKLHGGTARLLRYRLCADTVSLLSHSVAGLYEWVQPERPEDLALLFPDGTPWLTTIAHERDAYLTMTTDEVVAFFDECVALSRLLGPAIELPP